MFSDTAYTKRFIPHHYLSVILKYLLSFTHPHIGEQIITEAWQVSNSFNNVLQINEKPIWDTVQDKHIIILLLITNPVAQAIEATIQN